MKIRRLVTAFLTLLLVLSSLSFACSSAKAETKLSSIMAVNRMANSFFMGTSSL